MKTKTYCNKTGKLLGERLQYLESASLRLQKYTVVGEPSNATQLKAVTAVAKKNAKMFHPTEFTGFPNSESFKMKLMARMMVNQAEGLFENAGIKLHRFKNYPLIPGTALKGIARHAAWWEWSEASTEEQALEIAELFGYPSNEKKLDKFLEQLGYKETKGKVSFLDAVPIDQNWNLTVDILTPHHSCDIKNPTPVTFPAVDKGAVFSFTVISKNKKLRDKAVKWLKLALEEDGAGAKTAAGYGWFKEV